MPDVTTCRHRPGKPYNPWSTEEEIIQSQEHPDFSYSLWVKAPPFIYYKGVKISKCHSVCADKTRPWPDPMKHPEWGAAMVKRRWKQRNFARWHAETLVHWIINGNAPEEHILKVTPDRSKYLRLKAAAEKD